MPGMIMLLVGSIALLVLPFVELYLLIKIGSAIGVLLTIALLILKAIVGGYLIHRQGLKVMGESLAAAARGEPPVAAMLDAVGLAVAGPLLALPGVIVTVLGSLLLIGPVRRWAMARLFTLGTVRIRTVGTAETEAEPDRRWQDRSQAGHRPRPGARAADGSGPIIEGEFERLDERTVRPDRPGGSGSGSSWRGSS